MNSDNKSATPREPDDSIDVALRHAFAIDRTSATETVFETLGRAAGAAPRLALRGVPGVDRSPPRKPLDSTSLPSAGYRPIDEIARGAVGRVIRARDLVLGREVAVKVLLDHHRARPGLVRRFLEEAQIGSQLQHPGIVPVHEVGVTGDSLPFFSMKLVDGRTLREVLDEAEDSRAARTGLLRTLAQICQALAYAHARGVIHRDLKPANVMVGRYGEVYVMDWGTAKVLGSSGGGLETVRTNDDAHRSRTGSVIGTPAYMAPEQARGETEQLDERADVFGLGAILCEILTGAPPYEGDGRREVERQARLGELDGARARVAASGADPVVIELASECLAADRSQRPANAGVVAERLRTYLESVEERARQAELAAARAEAEAGQARRARRLSRALTLLIAVTAALSIGALTWWQRVEARRAEDAERAVAVGLEEAALHRGRAAATTPPDTDRWAVALSAGRRVLALADNRSVSAATRERARTLLAEIEAGAADAEKVVQQLRRDARFVARCRELDEAVTRTWDWGHLANGLTDALREYGLDIDTVRPQEVVAFVEGSAIRAELADALEWVNNGRRLAGSPLEESVRASEIWLAVEPDPWRSKVQDVLRSKAPLARLRELATSPETEPLHDSQEVADLLGYRGDVALAAAMYGRAARKTPGEFWVRFQHAYWLSQLGPERREEALREWIAAAALEPSSPVVYANMAGVLVANGELAAALECAKAAAENGPEFAPAHVNLGFVYFQNGDPARALAENLVALRLDPALPNRPAVIEILRGYRPDDPAVELLCGVLEADMARLPGSQPNTYVLDRPSGTVTAWPDLVAMLPDDPLLLCRLGQSLQGAGLLEEALSTLRRGHALGLETEGWSEPSATWVAECERALAARTSESVRR